jgi:hypothetical protein
MGTPARLEPAGRAPAAFGPLIISAALSATLVVCIMIAAAAVSMARAQTLNAIAEPDTSLVVAMLIAAIGVMGALSAVAVRLAGRFRI